jgi:hypothetical protein
VGYERRRDGGSGWVLLAASLLVAAGCKGGAGASAGDGGADGRDGAGEAPLALCPAPEGDPAEAASDDFGPNAKAVASSALGRVNIYEVTSQRQLDRVDLFVRSELAGTRVTMAVYEAAARDVTFRKVTDVQVEVPACQGWASSGVLAVPLVVGRFYAVGFDPNQAIVTYLNNDMSNIPVDGRFGRLIGSKTATSVSVGALGWDKISDKEFTRQRLVTTARSGDDPPPIVDTPDARAADAGDGASSADVHDVAGAGG